MDDSAEAYQARKRKLVSLHNENLRRSLAATQHCKFQATLTYMGDFAQKPRRPENSLDQLLPIHSSSLANGTVHYGRVLRGTLIVDPFVANAAHTIIEDEAGSAVLISFYNFCPGGLRRSQSQRVASSLLCRGKKVEIIEPYYKLANDGSHIVRVDDFSQNVIFLDHIGPRLSEGWCDEGEAHLHKQHFAEAIHCYRRSIDTHAESKLASILLSNIATSLLVKDDLVCSLLFAVASLVVDASMFRPYYTAGFVLNKLNLSDLAFNCWKQCQRLEAPENICQQLVAGFGNSRQEHVSASRWNADILSIVTSENVSQLLRIKSDTAIHSQECKERGNVLFKKKRYDESIQEYCIALRGIAEIAGLLNNRAICYARLGNHAEAALYSSAALLINPSLSKAHYWKAKSLLQLNHKREARACCETALSVVGGNGDLERLRERIGCSFDEPGTQSRRGHGLHQRITEREQEQMFKEGVAPASMVAKCNKMLESRTGGSSSSVLRGLGLKVDKRVSPFHLEFSCESKWPAACDAHSSMELLTNAYEHARAPDPVLLRNLKICRSNNLPKFDPKDLLKRLNCSTPSVMQWWSTAPLRSLSPKVRRPYESNIHHSFTNSPCRENVILLGTVHVSVGFVDLSELLCSRFLPSSDHSGPLRWIGYEASAYSVAKTMVIAEMISQQADTSDILQVWYSSSWSDKTLRSFRTALKDLMDATKRGDAKQCPEEVVMLWNHWARFDVSLWTARSEWLSRHSLRNHTEIANFRRKMDRIALCRYMVSGEVLDGTVGSVVMFGLPKNTDGERYELSQNEWFLHCLSIYTILEEVDSETNIIDAAIRILQKRISELKERVRAGSVEIEVRYKTITPEDDQTLHEIRKLSPHSMRWSNVCDYYSNEAFHKMARACSKEDTIHYLYSMNWSTEVKGAHLMDYPAEIHQEMLDEFKKGIRAVYRMGGVVQYLHEPPMTHSYNLATHALGIVMGPVWTDNFFVAANLDDRERQIGVIEPVRFDIVGRASNTINMVFTYDPSMSFNPVSGPRPTGVL